MKKKIALILVSILLAFTSSFEFTSKAIEADEHEHGDWIYTVEGEKIVVKCGKDCPTSATIPYSFIPVGNVQFDKDKEIYIAQITGKPIEFSCITYGFNGISQQELENVVLPTITYEAKSGSSLTDGKAVNIGNYSIFASNPNTGEELLKYDMEIIKRNIGIRAANVRKTYGDEDPEFSYNFAPGSFLIAGDSLDDINFSRVEGEDVGQYIISINEEQATESNPSYVISFNTGKLTIVPKEITVTADDLSKKYDEDDQKLTATISGLVKGDEENLITYTLTRELGEEPGTYIITPSGEEKQKNYIVKYAPGTYTIEKTEIDLDTTVVGTTFEDSTDGKIIINNTEDYVNYQYYDEATTSWLNVNKNPSSGLFEISNLGKGTYQIKIVENDYVKESIETVEVECDTKVDDYIYVKGSSVKESDGIKIYLDYADYEDKLTNAKVYIDDELLDKTNYSFKEGSIILHFNESYLKTLNVKTYNVTIEFGDNQTTLAKLSVVKKKPIVLYEIPNTGIR